MLSHLGPQFPSSEHPDLLVGLTRPDDAAVYVIDDDRALVQTLDFFAPLVDDPYQFGAIAAANAMSDVYAMGGRVLFALNIAAFPEDLPPEIIADILRGGADKVREAGAVVAGGHTIIDEEPKFGLAVTGEVARPAIRTTGGAQPGDTIILTKEIGTGVLIGASQHGAVSEEHWDAAVLQMMTLNRDAAEAASDPDLTSGVHAIADVTGFGLAGHLHEMAELSDAAIEIDLGAVPALGGLSEAVAAGFGSGGQDRNRDYYGARITVEGERPLTAFEHALLYDPQTSGGLLIAAGVIEAPHLIHDLQRRGINASPVARVTGTAPKGRLTIIPPDVPRSNDPRSPRSAGGAVS